MNTALKSLAVLSITSLAIAAPLAKAQDLDRQARTANDLLIIDAWQQKAAERQAEREQKALEEQARRAEEKREYEEQRARQMDSDQTIKSFLEAHGIRNVGPIEIDKLKAYMSKHHILHVSELGD